MMTEAPISRWQQWRMPLLIALILGIYVYARQSGLFADTHPEQIRNAVQQWGVYGVIFYVLIFCAGQLMHVPGIIFVITAGLIYGQIWGVAIALLGAAVGMSVTFMVVRIVGGTPVKKTKRPYIEKLLAKLHSRPITHIALIRLVVSTAPWLNYMLALSTVRFREYFVGSMLGIILPVTGVVYFTDVLIAQLF